MTCCQPMTAAWTWASLGSRMSRSTCQTSEACEKAPDGRLAAANRPSVYAM